MIRYALKCSEGHKFESWFQNAAAFETLASVGQISCPECGATEVEKSLMTPDVRPARNVKKRVSGGADPQAKSLEPKTEREQAIAKLKAKVEAGSDYVGAQFAREARAIHDGNAPLRSIYGEAKPEEALALLEDGVSVAPLPFTPTRKVN